MRTILLSAVLLLAQACSHKSAAEEEAAKWADTLYPGKPHTQMCVAKDTDGDGYVSCTVVIDGGAPIARECAGRWTTNEGCREPKLRLPSAK